MFFTNLVTISGTRNLIMSERLGNILSFMCPVVVTDCHDPQLGPLQNNTGPTPTMAIPLFSSAMGVADPSHITSIRPEICRSPASQTNRHAMVLTLALLQCAGVFSAQSRKRPLWLHHIPPPPPSHFDACRHCRVTKEQLVRRPAPITRIRTVWLLSRHYQLPAITSPVGRETWLSRVIPQPRSR